MLLIRTGWVNDFQLIKKKTQKKWPLQNELTLVKCTTPVSECIFVITYIQADEPDTACRRPHTVRQRTHSSAHTHNWDLHTPLVVSTVEGEQGYTTRQKFAVQKWIK